MPLKTFKALVQSDESNLTWTILIKVEPYKALKLLTVTNSGLDYQLGKASDLREAQQPLHFLCLSDLLQMSLGN